MARSDLVKALVRSHQNGDDRAFHDATEAIIQEERRKRHDLLADQIEAIMVESRDGHSRPLQVSSLKPLPKTRNDLPLVTIHQPSISFHDLELPADVTEPLEAVVEEFRLRSSLRAHGVEPRSSLLFIGPPGCGKSITAQALAGELGLAVVRVQLAAIVSSYLGETARNLEQIFNFLRTGSWVLVFDEFDMLGRERSDRTDHGELRRVVASMLQVIDDNDGDSLFVATTNHPSLLDSAVWRRFDEVLSFPLPDKGARLRLLELKLRGVRHEVDLAEVAERTDGYSPAQIENVCLDAIRMMVRRIERSVTSEHLAYGVAREEARRQTISNSQE